MIEPEPTLLLEVDDAAYVRATRDPLTGTYNWHSFNERLRAEVAFSTRHHTPLAMLHVDLDHFKQLNARVGLRDAAEALRATAQTLFKMVRAEDLVARTGHDKFAVIARGLGLRNAMLFGERVRKGIAALEIQSASSSEIIRFTCCVGVASFEEPVPKGDADSLFKAARDALQKAKDEGRNRVISG
jgi:diguanylate cyclase (GGDEF)-like protein